MKWECYLDEEDERTWCEEHKPDDRVWQHWCGEQTDKYIK